MFVKPAATVIFALCLALVCAPVYSAQDMGWVLKQKLDFIGPSTTYFGPKGLKVDSPGLIVICAAPDYQIYMLNAETKTYCVSSYDYWKSKLTKGYKTEVHYGPVKPITFSGLKATEMQFSRSYPGFKPPYFWKYAVTSTNEIPVSPKMNEAFAVLFQVPKRVGFPLKVFRVNSLKEKQMALNTYEWKKAPLPEGYLRVPSDYRRVKSEMEVMLDDDMKEMLRK